MINRLFFIGLCLVQVAFQEVFASDSLVVHQIKVIGNLRTKEKIIFRDMAIKQGDKLVKDKLSEARR